MQLPRPLVKVIDPATAYMQAPSPRPSGPAFRGGAIFGPGVPGGARQATFQELEEMRAHTEAARYEDASRERPSVDPAVTSAAARQLIDRGRTTLPSGDRELTAHVVTFWHGESVLQIAVDGPGIGSSSMSRVSRKLTAEHQQILTSYLTDALQTN